MGLGPCPWGRTPVGQSPWLWGWIPVGQSPWLWGQPHCMQLCYGEWSRATASAPSGRVQHGWPMPGSAACQCPCPSPGSGSGSSPSQVGSVEPWLCPHGRGCSAQSRSLGHPGKEQGVRSCFLGVIPGLLPSSSQHKALWCTGDKSGCMQSNILCVGAWEQ